MMGIVMYLFQKFFRPHGSSERSIVKGRTQCLYIYGSPCQPVRVENVFSNKKYAGWTFLALKGHAQRGGRITFTMFVNQNQMVFRVVAAGPQHNDCVTEHYLIQASKNVWANFAGNIASFRCQRWGVGCGGAVFTGSAQDACGPSVKAPGHRGLRFRWPLR